MPAVLRTFCTTLDVYKRQAINCAVGLGLHADYPTAIAAMTRVGQVFQPNPEAQRIYQQLYGQVYQRMYRQLKPLYQRIRKITGYPA